MPLSPAHIEFIKLLARLDCELEDEHGVEYDVEYILRTAKTGQQQAKPKDKEARQSK